MKLLHPFKSVDRKPQFSHNLSKKGPYLSQNFADDLHFKTGHVFSDHASQATQKNM